MLLNLNVLNVHSCNHILDSVSFVHKKYPINMTSSLSVLPQINIIKKHIDEDIGVINALNDFLYLLDNSTDAQYKIMNTICNAKTCKHFLRNYRDKSKHKDTFTSDWKTQIQDKTHCFNFHRIGIV
eukprot:524924_1